MISPELQETMISASAQRDGRRIVRWIRDLDDTGRSFLRKARQGIAAIEGGEAAEIRVYRYDRWGRNTHESLANIARVEHVGGAVVSATEPYDPETAIGKYNRTNALALAEMQSDIIGENWKAVMGSRLGRKLTATGTRRFGYVRCGRVPNPDTRQKNRWIRDQADPLGERYEPDPQTGPVLRELYERYVAGEGSVVLVGWLNSAGILTTYGNTWSTQALFSVLDAGFGAGLIRVHDPACKCKRGVRCGRAVWLPGSHEPVLGPGTWEKYQRRRAEQKTFPPRIRNPVYPLSGLLYCGECQKRLTVCSDHGHNGTGYRCRQRQHRRGCGGCYVSRPAAEDAVLAWLATYAADIDAAATAAAARRQAVTRSRTTRKRGTAQLAQIDGALTRLVTRRALDEEMPESVYEKSRAELLARRARAEAALSEAARAEAINAPDLLPVVAGLLKEWKYLPGGERREMLALLIRRITVHRAGPRQPPRIEIIPVWEMTSNGTP